MRVGGVKWHFITTCDSRYVAFAVQRADFWGENEMNYLSDKRLCEFLGTATLILVGCGAIAVGGFGSVVAQLIGGIVGAFILWLILQGKIAGYDVAAAGLGQNGWGVGYLGRFGL